VFTLVTTEYFLRRARRFLKKHPDLRGRFAQVLDDLKQDPFSPHLVYHQLGGRLQELQAVRINYDYRIILTIKITDKEVVLLDIGSHDEVYR
jgi:mRNA-degrading endonuclease YafQ of YafQ-DinJ toxin-antitoxin module